MFYILIIGMEFSHFLLNSSQLLLIINNIFPIKYFSQFISLNPKSFQYYKLLNIKIEKVE